MTWSKTTIRKKKSYIQINGPLWSKRIVLSSPWALSFFFATFKFVTSMRPCAAASLIIRLNHSSLPYTFLPIFLSEDFASLSLKGVFTLPLHSSHPMICLKCAGTDRGPTVGAGLAADTNEGPASSLRETIDEIGWVFAVFLRTDVDGARVGCGAWRA